MDRWFTFCKGACRGACRACCCACRVLARRFSLACFAPLGFLRRYRGTVAHETTERIFVNFDDGDKSWVDKASAQVVEKLPKPVKAPKRPKTVKAKPRPKVCACSYRCCLSGMAPVTTNGVQLAVCGLAKRRLVCSLRPLRSPLRSPLRPTAPRRAPPRAAPRRSAPLPPRTTTFPTSLRHTNCKLQTSCRGTLTTNPPSAPHASPHVAHGAVAGQWGVLHDVERGVLCVACVSPHCTEHLRGVCALCSVLQHVRKLDYAPAVASHARTLPRA